MASQISFDEFTFEGQQSTKNLGFDWDAPFPLALQAVSPSSATLQDHIEALKELTKSGKIFDLVKKHGGAVLIRGLPIDNAQDYSDAAHAFGFRAHEEVGRPPARTVLAKNVKTANEGPPELPIWPHNEYGWSTINPAWLTFSAVVPAETGGETPINSSIQLASRIKAEAPEFYEKVLKKGIRYVYRYGKEDVVSTTGTSVYGAYGQNVLPSDDEKTARAKIEEEVRRHSNVFEWNEDGSLTVTHTTPCMCCMDKHRERNANSMDTVIRIHKETGLTTWFGNVTSAWGRSTHHGATEPPFRGDDDSYHPPPLYGDGEQIEKKYLDLALHIAESSQVLVKWEKGDVVLLDNFAVMHSRSPWKGERKVLAALWDEDGRVDDFAEGKEILKEIPRRPILVQD
ncbi:unnamed protein product [Clonostachys solani]|uniref:TauD/TfdA-like domain-containing protein n=1 Tax=Clonostachys solani TaxID=160281 RepID=A0A9N9ZEQ5_9HYPO|nr:unnamed protein product [Clonostachys solani]